MAMSDSLITSDTDTLTEEDIRPVTEMYYDIEQDKLLRKIRSLPDLFPAQDDKSGNTH